MIKYLFQRKLNQLSFLYKQSFAYKEVFDFRQPENLKGR